MRVCELIQELRMLDPELPVFNLQPEWEDFVDATMPQTVRLLRLKYRAITLVEKISVGTPRQPGEFLGVVL